ncbi:MAG: ATP-binding protein [Saprospiraceae bacterium]
MLNKNSKLKAITLNAILLTLLFQFQSAVTIAQEASNVDSLIRNLDQKKGIDYVDQLLAIGNLQNQETDKVEFYQQAITKAKAIGYLKALAKANHKLGIHFGRNAKLEQALPYFDEAIRYANELNDLPLALNILTDKAYRYTMSGKTQVSFELLMEALQRAEKAGNIPATTANIHFELGNFHRLQHDVDKAVTHYNIALAYFEKEGDLLMQAQAIYGIGNSYKVGKAEDDPHQGIACMRKLLKSPYVEILSSSIKAKIETSLGGMLVYIDEYEKGEQFLLSSLAVKEANKDTMSMLYSYNELATLYAKWGQEQKSIFYGEKTLQIALTKDDIFSISDSYKNLADAYSNIKDFPKAYAYLSRVESLRDSIVNQEKAVALAQMETKYKTNIQKEQLARQALIINQQQYRTASLIGILLLFSLLAFLWFQSRLKFKAKETKQLEKLNANKTRFMTNISHELRTPLTLLINPLRQIHSSTKSENGRINIPSSELDRMLRNGERLERLINQMTDLSKFEEGNFQLQAKELDFVDFTVNIVESFKSIAVAQKKELSFFSTEKSILLYFDPSKMETILLNLLYNAFKFTEENDTINVLITIQNGKVQLQIQDSGIGIAAAQQPHIFDRFYQSNDRDTRKYDGTGIGLSLVKEMVDLHRGTIRVESDLGVKTNFILNFLLNKAHLSNHEIIARDDWQTQKINLLGENYYQPSTFTPKAEDSRPLILLLEDNTDLLSYLEEQLKQEYQIITAQSGTTGLEKAFKYIPELILSDVMMPGMDGFEFCKTIKADHRTSHIPIILLTAKAAVENIQVGLTAGADDYIAKPFNQAILFTKIKNLITQRRKLRILFSEKLVVKSSEIKVTSKEDQFLVELLKIVEENISNPNFGVDELSRKIGFSRSQFYRKLKAITNQSPAVFIRTIRLDRAKQLLEQSAGNASEIAYMVGFNNPNYFFKCFKDQFGMRPKDFIVNSTKKQ